MIANQITRIYYKSDFDFELKIVDCNGKALGWPKCRWDVLFWTGTNKSEVFRIGVDNDGKPYGCYDDGGKIHAVFDGHNLGAGVLMAEIHLDYPDTHYPDGVKNQVFISGLDIELVATPRACCCSELKATAFIPITTAEVFGDTVDKINARLEGILGGKVSVITPSEEQPSATKSVGAVNGPAILQRGMISLGAREGVVYRNLGYIKLGTIEAGETKTYDLSGVDMGLIEGVCLCGNDNVPDYSIDNDQKTLILTNDMDPTSARLIISRTRHEFLMRKDGVIQACDNGFLPIEPVLPIPIITASTIAGNLEDILDAIQQTHLNYKLEAWKKRRRRDHDTHKINWKWSRSFSPDSACGIVRVRWINRRGLKSAWSVFSFCRNQIAPLS